MRDQNFQPLRLPQSAAYSSRSGSSDFYHFSPSSHTMSTAHRPTWTPAQGKNARGNTRQFSARDMAAHTKLKFRQPGQGGTSDVQKRDLRAELLAAEEEARRKKRKAEGLPEEEAPRAIEGVKEVNGKDEEGEEANKRRKVLQEALEMDKDDDDEEKEDGKKDADADGDEEEEDDDDDDDDDDEDETAELLRELEKIKRERAEEKARLEQENSVTAERARDEEIATGNPLLNLAAALGQTPSGSVGTGRPGGFVVKKRWDDDLIFKNQAINGQDKSNGFVNDLLRTEFHRRFMNKFIK
ncbi:Cwf15/Cwc15 cell cycle control protein [Calocera viscosa TUFC12733]|uniref:Cwf15/Cwc15 cell cycle control protein n=1 Tax=Calocera viscosa (strain TUFC12733) TaxID=1330018 RepID=A0A167I4C0_CALVF|nr:Cwf15/Cwc15 cell cycle control protein [Calocera viscosa TUFC12733]